MLTKSFPALARQLGLAFSKSEVRKLSLLTVQQVYRQNIAPLQPTTSSIVVRNYAKTKDVRKEKKKHVQIDEEELSEFLEVESLLKDLAKPVEVFKNDLSKHATLRSTQGAIEEFKIVFEGQKYALQDLAEFGKKGNNVYVLDFCNFPQTITTAVNSLQSSEMNLNVQQEGTKVYIPIVKVTKEHRENLAKKSKALFVRCKDNIRKNQFKYVKELEKVNKLSTEIKINITEQITALGDKQIEIAEGILKEKEKELLKTD